MRVSNETIVHLNSKIDIMLLRHMQSAKGQGCCLPSRPTQQDRLEHPSDTLTQLSSGLLQLEQAFVMIAESHLF